MFPRFAHVLCSLAASLWPSLHITDDAKKGICQILLSCACLPAPAPSHPLPLPLPLPSHGRVSQWDPTSAPSVVTPHNLSLFTATQAAWAHPPLLLPFHAVASFVHSAPHAHSTPHFFSYLFLVPLCSYPPLPPLPPSLPPAHPPPPANPLTPSATTQATWAHPTSSAHC